MAAGQLMDGGLETQLRGAVPPFPEIQLAKLLPKTTPYHGNATCHSSTFLHSISGTANISPGNCEHPFSKADPFQASPWPQTVMLEQVMLEAHAEPRRTEIGKSCPPRSSAWPSESQFRGRVQRVGAAQANPVVVGRVIAHQASRHSAGGHIGHGASRRKVRGLPL